MQQPVIHGAVEQIERYLDLDVRGYLSPFDGAPEECPALVPARLDETLPVPCCEVRVSLCLSDERSEESTVRSAALPANSAIVQPFFRSHRDSSPSRYVRARMRVDACANLRAMPDQAQRVSLKGRSAPGG